MAATPKVAREALNEANYLYTVGNFEESLDALIALEKSLPRDAIPFRAQVLHNMGVCHKELAGFTRAHRHILEAKGKFEEALKLRPKNDEPDNLKLRHMTQCELAQILILQGDTQHAQSLLKKAQQEFRGWKCEMALAHLNRKDTDVAKQHVQRAQDIALSEPDYLECLLDAIRFFQSNELPCVKEMLKEASEIARSWHEEIEVDEEWAVFYALKTNYKEAILLYKKVLQARREKCRRHPKHFAALMHFSRLCINCKDIPQARKAVQEARQLAQSHSSKAAAMCAEATVYEAENDYDTALNCCEQAKKLPVSDPGVRAQIYFILGNLYRRKKELRNAEQCYGDALDALGMSSYQPAYFILAKARILHEMGLLWQCLEKMPEAEVHLLRSCALRRELGQPSETFYPTYKALAQFYMSQNPSQAEKMLLEAEAAVRHCSSYSACCATYELGQFYYAHGRIDKAEPHLLKAKRLAMLLDAHHDDCKNAQVLQIRACESLMKIYRAQGKHNLAREQILDSWAMAKLCPIKMLERIIAPLDKIRTAMIEDQKRDAKQTQELESSVGLRDKIIALFSKNGSPRTLATNQLFKEVRLIIEPLCTSDIVVKTILATSSLENGVWSLKT